MALKRPTPVKAVRRLKDSRKTVKPKTLTESERKRALDSREASLERRWQRLLKEKRALLSLIHI